MNVPYQFNLRICIINFEKGLKKEAKYSERYLPIILCCIFTDKSEAT